MAYHDPNRHDHSLIQMVERFVEFGKMAKGTPKMIVSFKRLDLIKNYSNANTPRYE